MEEIFHPDDPDEIPDDVCEYCGKQFQTQVYELTQIREKVTRRWRFCKLVCARDWAKNAR